MNREYLVKPERTRGRVRDRKPGDHRQAQQRRPRMGAEPSRQLVACVRQPLYEAGMRFWFPRAQELLSVCQCHQISSTKEGECGMVRPGEENNIHESA